MLSRPCHIYHNLSAWSTAGCTHHSVCSVLCSSEVFLSLVCREDAWYTPKMSTCGLLDMLHTPTRAFPRHFQQGDP